MRRVLTVRQSTVLRQNHSSADEAGIRLHGNSAGNGSWNAILWPLLVLKGAEKFTLPIGLNTLLTPYGNNYDVLIAGSMFRNPADPGDFPDLPEVHHRRNDSRSCKGLM